MHSHSNSDPDRVPRLADVRWATRYSRDGVHLFERRTGTNVLLDEVSVPRPLWSQAPRQVSIALLNACDLACPHCFAPKEHARLPDALVMAWAAELAKNGCLGVGFGGGEPTIHPQLAEICHHVAKNTCMAVSITTHGHHLTPELAARLRGAVHFLRLSMDGVGKTYERLRGRSFEDFVRRLAIAQSIAPVGINFVVNRLTLDDLNVAITFAERHGIGDLLLLPEQPTAKVPGVDERTLDLLRDLVEKHAGRVRLSISEASSTGFPVCNPFDADNGLSAYGHIDAQGMARATSFSTERVPIGSGSVVEAFTELSAFLEEAP